MSIYALPGPLWKRISGVPTKSSKADAHEACSSKDTATSRLDSSAQQQGAGCPSAPFTTTPSNPLLRRSSSGSNSASQGNAKIAVKEAKIDPARFIRSLSQSSDTKKTKATSKAVATSEGASDDASSSKAAACAPSSSSSSQRRRRSRKNSNTMPDDCADSSRPCDPHEDAINFEISVSFNGREYTATRTLPRILQFRYDLIEEFRARRMWRERRRKRKGDSSSSSQSRSKGPPKMAKVRYLSDDESEEDDSIPELPRLSEDAAGSSGFTMLNALLRPYGPALERWLLNVLDIVPHDSQCLTQFLWEPLSGHAAASSTNTSTSTSSATTKHEQRRGSYERRNSSMSTLGAIQENMEDLDIDPYDSDTDAYLLNH